MKNIFTFPAILVFICATLAINSCSEEPNYRPVASIILPIEYSAHFLNESMDIRINAYDYNGRIAQVEIFLNGASIAILNSGTNEYRYDLKNIQPGDYNLKVVVTDDQGEQVLRERSIRVLPEPKEFVDSRDGNVYRYVTIGNQTWMIDNLAYLPEVSPPIEESDSTSYFYVYEYDGNDVSAAKQREEYSKFGALYNFEAAQQAAPEGWHLPTFREWVDLRNYMLSELGEFNTNILMHASEGGINYFGFSAVSSGMLEPGYVVDWMEGSYYHYPGGFIDNGYTWWSSDHEWDGHSVKCFCATRRSGVLDSYEPATGLPIRCIKD